MSRWGDPSFDPALRRGINRDQRRAGLIHFPLGARYLRNERKIDARSWVSIQADEHVLEVEDRISQHLASRATLNAISTSLVPSLLSPKWRTALNSATQGSSASPTSLRFMNEIHRSVRSAWRLRMLSVISDKEWIAP